ncbi:MAG: hypothetical protein BIFFINMI_02346 [Phycisphaerae bacterium]|nr:hypothetical protein [Phycisphaerae bacterium]
MSKPSYDPHAAEAAANPRAFAQGVGRVCQVWGVLLVMVMCCAWSASSEILERTKLNEQIVTGAAIVAPLALGFGFMAVGVGLVGHRISAAWGAMGFAIVQLGMWVAILVARIVEAPTPMGLAVAILFTLLSLAILALSIGAVRNLRANPPPPELFEIPPDFQEPHSYLDPKRPGDK